MSDLGISYLPYYAIKNQINEGKLKVMECSPQFDRFWTQLAYHKDKWISNPLSKFIEIAIKYSYSW